MLNKLLGIFSVLVLFVATTLPLFADVSTSATIPPRQSDFQFNFTADSTGTNFSQDQTISYTITYGSLSSAGMATHTALTVDYSSDTINGAHVTDYVLGSASSGYGGSIPVVDTINRKITWTIPSLPQGVTNQTVTFKLKTNSNYTGLTSVGITTNATMSNDFFSLPTQTIQKTYTYAQPAPQPTATPTPTPLLTPTPPHILTPGLSISDVFFNTILDTQANVSIHTTFPAKLSVFYGTKATNLSQTFATGYFSSFTTVSLTGLTPATVYYLQVSAVDETGNKTSSEIFTFKTATTSPILEVNKSTAILTSNGNVLTNVTQQQNQHANIQAILPNTAPYEVTYSVPPSTKVKYIEVAVRNKHVLGINTYALAQESNVVLVPMIEKQPGVWYAQLPPILLSGNYEVYVRVTETTGNIYEQKVSDITVSLPLQVLEKGTNKPLGDARAFFYFYNTQTKQYLPITQDFGTIKNPDFTDAQGFVHTVLPKGTYKVTVSALFHNEVSKIFTMDSTYPTIYLDKAPYNPLVFVRYFTNTVSDFMVNLNTYVYGISLSVRYFNVLASLIILLSIFLGFFLFSLRAYVPLTALPTMLYHHLHHTFLPKTEAILFGKVIAPDNTPLPHSDIYILDEGRKVLAHITTNRQGIFSYKRQKEASIIEIMQEGYDRISIPLVKEPNTLITLPIHHHVTSSIRKQIAYILERIGSFFLETVMALSLFLELEFVVHFGFWKALPFFLLSLINILLWLFYTKETVRNYLRK